MKRARHVKEGPTRERYGMSIKKNKEIDEKRKYIANSQNQVTKRDRLSRSVHNEGGEVYWRDEDRDGEVVLTYTKKEHEKLLEREEKVAKKLKNYAETYRPRGLLGKHSAYITRGSDLDEFFQGEAPFDLNYDANGSLRVVKMEKGKVNGRVYSLTEANNVLRNIERYVDTGREMNSFSERHKKREGLGSTALAVIAIAGIGYSTLLFSDNITGNAVSSSVYSSNNIAGVVLLIAGIIALFFYLKKKRK